MSRQLKLEFNYSKNIKGIEKIIEQGTGEHYWKDREMIVFFREQSLENAQNLNCPRSSNLSPLFGHAKLNIKRTS